MNKLSVSLILLSVINVCCCKGTYELAIYGESQNGYYVSVCLGTPPQEIKLLLDTGSSNIAVACVPTKPHSVKYFHFNKSSTLQTFDKTVDIHYVVGRWKGFLTKDILHFSSVQFKTPIACMTSIHKVFDEFSMFQGLLGLGYSSIALPEPSVLTFMDSLVSSKSVTDLFSLDLCGPYFTSKEHSTDCGKFQIGNIATTYHEEDIIYTPLYKAWYYQVTITGFRVGTSQAPVHCSELNNERSIVDSGTTELYLPTFVFNFTLGEIKSAVKVPSKFWINETVACMPTVQFNITTFPLVTISLYHTKNSFFDLVITPELYLLTMQAPYANATCFKLGFATSNVGFYIGSSILKGFYVVFDRQNEKVGFANSSHFDRPSGLKGFVQQPKHTVKNLDSCTVKHNYNLSDVSPFMIILLCVSIFMACVLLYTLISWLLRHFLNQSDESSDTNSLVENEDDHSL